MPAPPLPDRQYARSALLALASTTLVLLLGCGDPSVDILQPSDQFQFSLFGALDVAADTQVIRVEPLGDSTQVGAPRDLDATVLLENLDSGEQISLRDSLTTFGAEPIAVHNLWTTHPIRPSTSYRIVVRSGGASVTTATTTTPSRPPTLSHTAFPDTALFLPCVFPENPNNEARDANSFTVTAQDVDRIAGAEVIYPLRTPPSTAPRIFDHLEGVEQNEDLFNISVFYRRDLVRANPTPPPPPAMRDCASPSDFQRPYAQVIVAAGGPDWPDWRGLPLDQIARPDSFSNVDGGNGFIGAVYSDTVEVPVANRP